MEHASKNRFPIYPLKDNEDGEDDNIHTYNPNSAATVALERLCKEILQLAELVELAKTDTM